MTTYMEMEEFLSKGSREVCLSGDIMLCLIIIYQPLMRERNLRFLNKNYKSICNWHRRYNWQYTYTGMQLYWFDECVIPGTYKLLYLRMLISSRHCRLEFIIDDRSAFPEKQVWNSVTVYIGASRNLRYVYRLVYNITVFTTTLTKGECRNDRRRLRRRK